jgi:lipoate-protein ligase B
MNQLSVARAGVVPFAIANQWQRELHRMRIAGEAGDALLLLEHPHTYSLGRRFKEEHLLAARQALIEQGIDVEDADRGGSITYHGPGQLIGYPILDLRRSELGKHPTEQHPDAIRYLRMLEEVIVRATRSFGVISGRREGMTGVWVGDAKLASIGVNVSRGVSRHGFALNVSTDLSYFNGMVACGIQGGRHTSLSEILGARVEVAAVADAIVPVFAKVFHRMPIASTIDSLLGLPPRTEREALRGRVIDFPSAAGGI